MSYRRAQRGRRALQVEALEERVLLAVEPLTLIDPSFWGESAMGVSRNVSLSADGQRVAFESQGLNVVPNDFNSGENNDIFVFDRGSGRTHLVSVNATGTASGNAESIEPLISPDGRYVVFLSDATDLVAGATVLAGGGNLDVFVRDLQLGRTFLISSSPDGTTGGNNGSTQASIVNTPNGGAVVVFSSNAANLVTGDTNNRQDVFARELQSDGTLLPTRRVSVASGGTQADNNSSDPRASGNGRFVVFASNADNLVGNDDNTARDLFLHDLHDNTTELITISADGLGSANGSSDATLSDQPISDDGRFVVFSVTASNLTNESVASTSIAYLRDRTLGETRILSRGNGSVAGVNGFNVVITGNGNFAGFVSTANDVASDVADTNGRGDVFRADLRNLPAIGIRLVSVNSAGSNGGDSDSGTGDSINGSTFTRGFPAISPDGMRVAFGSTATNLVAGITDANNTRNDAFGSMRRDVFVRDLSQNRTELVSVSLAGNRTGDSGSFLPRLSADGRTLAFQSFATDLVAGDANATQDIFLRDLSAGVTELVSRRSPLLPLETLANAGGNAEAVTPDGRFVAFTSSDTTQLAPDISILPGHENLFVRDTITGQVRVATVLPNGTQTGGGAVFNVSLSADGRYVAFIDSATGLDATVTGSGVYLRDLLTGVTKLISRNTVTGAVGTVSGNNSVVVSPDGRWVAFTCAATNLIDGVTVPNGQFNLYVYDRVNNALRLVSLSTSGSASGNGTTGETAYQPVFSADSSRLVYVSRSSDLIVGVTDTNNIADVFAYDLTGPNAFTNQLVSVSTTANTAGNGDSGGNPGFLIGIAPSVSADGRYVAFLSAATNLTAESTGGFRQVFVRDLQNNTTQLVSFNLGNTAGANGHSLAPQISADGTRVLFQSAAGNLTATAGNGFSQLYVRDLTSNTTQLVSVSTTGGVGNNTSGVQTTTALDRARLSANGRFIAFNSRATDLVPNFVSGGAAAPWNLYVRDLHTGITALVSHAHTGTTAGDEETTADSSAARIYLTDSGQVTFTSNATNLVHGDRNRTTDVFAYTFRGAGVIGGTVFRDDDGDGTQNGVEPGLSFRTVFLDTNGNRRFDAGEENVQTDAAGNYAFTGLAAGEYTLAVVLDNGFQATAPDFPHTHNVTLASATSSVLDRDFGAMPAAVDLVADNVTVTPVSEPGQRVTVSWIGRNAGDTAITVPFQDAVFLSRDQLLDASDLLLATAPHEGTLAGNSVYTNAVTMTLPAVQGEFFVLVKVDRRHQVPNESNLGNNLTATTTPFALDVPSLPLGVTTLVPFDSAQPEHYFQLTVSAGESLRLALASAAGSGLSELFVSRGRLPTSGDFDLAAALSQPDQEIVIPTTQAGTYFVLARGVGGAAATTGFTLTPTVPSFGIDSIDTPTGGNFGLVTIGVRGRRFTSATQFQLVSSGTIINPFATVVRDNATAFVTFNLSGRTAALYDLRAVDGANNANLAGAFTIEAAVTDAVQINLITPAGVRRQGRQTSVLIEYVNLGNTDAVAPIIEVTATDALLRLPDEANFSGDFTSSAVQFLAIAPDGPAGVLRPGQRHQARVFLLPRPGEEGVSVNLEASVLRDFVFPPLPSGFLVAALTSDPLALDWESVKEDLRPDFASAGWDLTFDNFLASVGSTIRELNEVLSENATYLSNLGDRTSNVARLLQFELTQADGSLPLRFLGETRDVELTAPGFDLILDRFHHTALDGRNRIGPLGRGWGASTPFDYQGYLDPTGERITLFQGGITRGFVRSGADSVYRAAPGDPATLTSVVRQDVPRAFELRERDGTVLVFSQDMANATRLDLVYVEEPSGNRLTLSTRTESGLTIQTLTHSAGPALELTYEVGANGVQILVGVTELLGAQPTGRTVAYTYDAFKEHLLSVTTTEGTTRYTYVTGQGAAREHALDSITFPDGTRVFYDYDEAGRLSGFRRADGVEEVTLAYDSVAGVTFTDALGVSTVLYNDRNQPEEVRDALGRTTRFDYDAVGNLIQIVSPLGGTANYRYDDRSNLVGITDALGHQQSFGYDTMFNLLTSATDARGHTTLLERDEAGLLRGITYADGSQKRFSYDPLGNLTDTINRRGQTTRRTLDPQTGQVTREDFADGSAVTYAYEADRLVTVVEMRPGSADRTTTFRRDDATFPDAITRVDSPGGRFLEFTYDAGGRRGRSVDQDGFTVNYIYNALGQLFELRDGTDALLVRYGYDEVGRLVLRENGNGTYTTYEYDAADQLRHLVHRGPRPGAGQDGPVNARFDYTYDADGRRTRVDTLDGATLYEYDAHNQLTRVTLPEGRSIQYEYDAAGNRTRVVDSLLGTTVYEANDLNQIVRAGDTTFTYDADGNLIGANDSTQTTKYTWDDRNQLVGVTGPDGVFRYEYDAFRNRVAAERDGVRTEYHFDPADLGDLVGEYGPAGRINYVHGYGLISRTQDGVAAYYDFDALGSTVGISDAAGSYVNRYRYLPFGEKTVSAGVANLFQFVGEYGVTDDGNGLAHMRLRNFSSVTGQFNSDDPIGLGGGDVNVRHYVGNNPLSLVDVDGLAPNTPATPAKKNPNFTLEERVTLAKRELEYRILLEAMAGVARGADFSGSIPVRNYLADEMKKLAKKYQESGNKDRDALIRFRALKKIREERNKRQNEAIKANAALNKLLGDVPRSVLGRVLRTLGAIDPNDIQGPSGFGAQQFVRGDQVLPYTIRFENIATATAPAQEVFVTHPLDADLDVDTFQLGGFGWGGLRLSVPAGLQSYQTRIATTNQDGSPLAVDIDIRLDRVNGVVRWTFRSLDPMTGDFPEDPLAGFLPPNDANGRGEGFVDFTIRPKTTLASGTVIAQQASIVFDTNAAIATNVFVNTIDAAPPTSSVNAVPATTGATSFVLSWQGSDDAGGSGLATYDIFYSIDGGEFLPLLLETTRTSGIFDGTPGHTYAFYSVATDNVGQRQATPEQGQVTTQMVAANTSVKLGGTVSATIGKAVKLKGTVKKLAGASGKVAGTVTFIEGNVILGTAPVKNVNGAFKATFTTSTLAVGKHVLEALYNGNGGLTTSTSATRSVQMLSPTTTTVISSAPTALLGSAVTFTATVTAPGASIPVGTVSFFDVFNGVKVLLQTVNVDPATGTATLDISSLRKGTHKISARYNPTTGSDFLASKSATITQLIQASALKSFSREQAEPGADLLDAVFARWR